MSAVEVQALATETIDEVQSALRQAQALQEKITEYVNQDPLPLEFTGIIHNYRFGNGDEAAPDGMPSHRFEVESGGGLWLHVSVGSALFDPFLKAADLGVLNTSPDNHSLNGKLVKVRRDPAYGRVVPVELVVGSILRLEDQVVVDSKGNSIFEGAKGFYEKREIIIGSVDGADVARGPIVVGTYNDESGDGGRWYASQVTLA